MPDDNAFYIVTVAGGKCLENTQGPHGVLDCLHKELTGQHWIVESSDSDENTIAIKSCADGKYLRNNEPSKLNWARIGMGEEKQWWTLEKGRAPGSCLIRSNECTVGASYLNDFNGQYQDNNYVHMWQMERHLEFWLTWYFMDATGPAFNPQQQAAVDDTAEKDMKAREEALAKRTKDLEQREAALKREKPQAQQQKPAVSCGHNVRPPPRKLERKVAGYIYAQG